MVRTRPQISPLSQAWPSDLRTGDAGTPETSSSSSWETISTLLDEMPGCEDKAGFSFGVRYCELPEVRRLSLLSLEFHLTPKTNSAGSPPEIFDDTDLSDEDQSPSKHLSKVKAAIPRKRNGPLFFKDYRRDSGTIMGRSSRCDQIMQFLEESLVVF